VIRTKTPSTRTSTKHVAPLRVPRSLASRPVSTASTAAASQDLLPLLPTLLPTPTVLQAVIGPPSQLPMASQPAHGVRLCQPAGRPNMDQAALVDLVEEPLVSVADLEDGAHNLVDHSLQDNGEAAPSDSPVLGLPEHGQSGGTATSAQLLTGLAGLPVPGLPALHGLPGLLALRPLLLLPSTLLLHSEAADHTLPPALATRLPRPLLPVLPQHKPLALVALPPLPLQVVQQPQLSWASSPCFKSVHVLKFENKKSVMNSGHFLGFVHRLR